MSAMTSTAKRETVIAKPAEHPGLARLTDRRLLRPSEAGQFLEKPLWLPDSYVTFAPPPGEPPVGPPPILARGRVAFGCFNNATKIGPKVVRLWGRLLPAQTGVVSFQARIR